MADVKLEDISKRFGKVIAVDHISLYVRDKEFIVLLGPSGCGKTTTLRIIAGLEKPDTGRVYIGGVDVTDLHPSERDVAMVFQNYALYPHMKVYDNIAFPLRLRKYSESEIRRKVLEVAKMLRIDDLLDRYPRQLSGGQQQRVALARAIVRNPKVFLMDEPLSNLDAKLRVYMRAELKRLQKELGVTTIYVTHDQAEAMTMADRIAVMNKGRILQVGEPMEIYRKPANVFVAGFIGSPSMNFVDGIIKKYDNKIYFESSDFKLDITDLKSVLPENIVGLEVILGIRPEDVVVSFKENKGYIKGTIYVVEPLGSDTILDVKLNETMFKIRIIGSVKANIGDPVWINIPLNKLHLFDKKTEKLII
jgi:multiple sugar transport system ATP-binding protein